MLDFKQTVQSKSVRKDSIWWSTEQNGMSLSAFVFSKSFQFHNLHWNTQFIFGDVWWFTKEDVAWVGSRCSLASVYPGESASLWPWTTTLHFVFSQQSVRSTKCRPVLSPWPQLLGGSWLQTGESVSFLRWPPFSFCHWTSPSLLWP